jgi:hypothetical protein
LPPRVPAFTSTSLVPVAEPLVLELWPGSAIPAALGAVFSGTSITDAGDNFRHYLS